jgi:two-component system, chemotaxis family, response regulator Rcp1
MKARRAPAWPENERREHGGPCVNFDPYGRAAEVLLVEDNPSDVALTRHLFAAVALPVNLSVARDGEEAVAQVRRQADGGGDGPDLILLDLNLPRMSGLEVLGELKADERLRRIPVIVLTTSSAEQDVRSAYGRHANAYVTKPVDLDQFIRVIGSIEQFWLSVVRLPEARDRP